MEKPGPSSRSRRTGLKGINLTVHDKDDDDNDYDDGE